MPEHYQPVHLPNNVKDDDYFIAVMKGQDVHSFVMLGVIVEKKPVFLARVGKFCDSGIGWLEQESLYLFGKFSYQACAITYAQYIVFIELMRKNYGAQTFKCYQRSIDSAFYFKAVERPKKNRQVYYPLSSDEHAVLHGTKTLHPLNTCRHTSTDIMAYVIDDKITTDRISQLFFLPLSTRVYFNDGETRDYFYVPPLPPKAYCNARESLKYKRLTVIYQRMEALIKKDEESPVTINKFEALKQLYMEQAGLPDARLDVALQSILQWQEDNRTLVSCLRKPSFFTRCFGLKSSTETMTNTLAEELEESLTLT